jgi:hypothetical protein
MDGAGNNDVYATYAVEHVGAGSITDPSGTIVMNRDGINNAREITVTPQDGKPPFKAQLRGKGDDNHTMRRPMRTCPTLLPPITSSLSPLVTGR